MDPQHYWRVLVKSWPLVLVLAVLGAAAGYGFAQTQPDSYRATSSVFVSAAEGSDPNELLQGSSYTQNLVQSYTRLATAPVVLAPVIADLGLDSTPVQLARQITAENPLNTVIIDVAVVDADPQLASDIANAVTRSLSQEARSLSPESAAGLSTLSVAPIADATPPQQPVGPNRRLITLTGFAAGLVLGIVVALLRSVLDTRVRTPRDVEDLRLAGLLGSVTKRGRGSLALADDPQGAAADDVRRVRAQIQFADVDSPVRSFTVSSSDDADDRAAVALDLALAFAERGLRVLVVDADLRGSAFSEVASLGDRPGLTDVVVGHASIGDAVTTWREGVEVLTAGERSPNPSPLLSSATMGRLVATAVDEHDVVLVVSSSVLSSSDVLEVGRLTDGVLLVATAGRSSRKHLARAVHELQGVQVPVLGIVLDGTAEGKGGSSGTTSGAAAARRRTVGADLSS